MGWKSNQGSGIDTGFLICGLVQLALVVLLYALSWLKGHWPDPWSGITWLLLGVNTLIFGLQKRYPSLRYLGLVLAVAAVVSASSSFLNSFRDFFR